MEEFVEARNSANFTVKELFDKKAKLDLLFANLSDEESESLAIQLNK
jgi:hypothetical protein